MTPPRPRTRRRECLTPPRSWDPGPTAAWGRRLGRRREGAARLGTLPPWILLLAAATALRLEGSAGASETVTGSALESLSAWAGGAEPLLPLPVALRAARGPGAPRERLALPFVAQETDYSCGPAALLSVLRYWGEFPGTERDLYGPLETTPKDGTTPEKLAEFARKRGLSAELREGMTVDGLRDALRLGRTVIVDLQAWRSDAEARTPWSELWEDGHYVVLAAMAETKAFFMDPSVPGALAWLPLEELPERWHDYEDRSGSVRRNFGLGIVIHGDSPRRARREAGRRPVRLE